MAVQAVGGLLNIFVSAVGTGVKALGVFIIAFLVLLVTMQRNLLYLPPQGPPALEPGLSAEVIRVKARGKEATDPTPMQAAVYFKPPTDKSPVLVYFHGNGDWLSNGPAYLGSYFASRGLGFYGIEYPGYGFATPGSPSEGSVNEAAAQMVDHLTGVLGVQKSRVVLFGHSLGAAVAMELAARGYGDRLVLIAPFTSIIDMASCVLFPFLKGVSFLLSPFVADKYDNLAKARSLDIPTLVMHGQNDEVVPFWMGEKVGQTIPNSSFRPIAGMSHNDFFNVPEVLDGVVAFATGMKP